MASGCGTRDARASRATIRRGRRVEASALHVPRLAAKRRARSRMVATDRPAHERPHAPPVRQRGRLHAVNPLARRHRTPRRRTENPPAPLRHTASLRRDQLRRLPARLDPRSRSLNYRRQNRAPPPWRAVFVWRQLYFARRSWTTFGGVGQRESGAHADRVLGRNRPRRSPRHPRSAPFHDTTPPSH